MQYEVAGKLARAVLVLAVLSAACSDDPSGPMVADPVVPPPPSRVATSMEIYAGNSQSAAAREILTTIPAVLVNDAAGLALADVSVHFAVTSGGGSIEFATAVTDAQGIARAGRWTLGATPGPNLLEASVPGLQAVSFAATATPPFTIVVRYITNPTLRQSQAVESAVARWESVITRDVADVVMSAPAQSCFDTQPALNENVDDIVIFVDFANIDGAGKTLGQAGPCYVRDTSLLPVVGYLELDAADLLQMESAGTMDDIVLHEIGHVLGIGTVWSDRGLVGSIGTADPQFLGANAIAAYQGMGGMLPAVPVENTGTQGTREAHWRESVFGNELMTGYISGIPNPMSALTIASLQDLGYGADTGAASTYRLGGVAQSARTPIDLRGREKVLKPKFKVDRRGNHAKIRQ